MGREGKVEEKGREENEKQGGDEKGSKGIGFS